MSNTPFNSSSSLRRPAPHAAQAAAAAAVSSSSAGVGVGVDAPSRAASKWWTKKFGLGTAREVHAAGVRPGKKAGSPMGAQFRASGGGAAVSELSFGPGSGPVKKGGVGPLAVACGPRVGLFGGGKIGSELDRALRPDAARRKRVNEGGGGGDDDDEEVDLFGGSGGNSGSGDSIKADRNVPTGGLLAHCVSYRSDGRLVAVGTEGGGVKVCDANGRATLRTFSSKAGKGGAGGAGEDVGRAVRSAAWLRDGKRLASGGDDGVVRIWNLGQSDPEIEFRGHGDAVRAVAVLSIPRDGDAGVGCRRGQGKQKQATYGTACDQLAASGSYDHTVRVWDIPTLDSDTSGGRDGNGMDGDRCIAVMDHGCPVEALLVVPPEDTTAKHPLLVSAGGTVLKIWNPLSGKCLGTVQTRHAKTITSACLLDIPEFDADDDDDVESDGEGEGMQTPRRRRRRRQILTAGLDGLLRVHSASFSDLSDGLLPHLCGFRISSDPVTSLALSKDASRLAFGTSTGFVSVCQRNAVLASGEAAHASEIKRQKDRAANKRRALPGTHAHFMRGANEASHDPDDCVLVHEKKRRLAPYDVLLRKFRYGDALDRALETRRPEAVAAVVEELGKRRGLVIALSNRDEEGLEQILAFTIRYVSSPRFTPLLIGVAHVLCDVYGPVLGQSALVDELFAKLRKKVRDECGAQRMLLRLVGQIDSVMGAAEVQRAEEEAGVQRS